MSKVFCSKCRHILGPPYVPKDQALCCATVKYVKRVELDWYEDSTVNVAEGHVLCSLRNKSNNCSRFEEKPNES